MREKQAQLKIQRLKPCARRWWCIRRQSTAERLDGFWTKKDAQKHAFTHFIRSSVTSYYTYRTCSSERASVLLSLLFISAVVIPTHENSPLQNFASCTMWPNGKNISYTIFVIEPPILGEGQYMLIFGNFLTAQEQVKWQHCCKK